jgi:cbb3-type cytochrome oxidase maturation protein
VEGFYLMIPAAILFALAAVAIYLWAVNNGQFDDLDKAANSVLFEDETPAPRQENKQDDPADNA